MINYLFDADTTFVNLGSSALIKKGFIRYHTTKPSSAVNRLFSSAGLFGTPRRRRLNDSMFEKLLLLKFNKH